jgi:RimJ/RimL family protein N-acetyltransferase
MAMVLIATARSPMLAQLEPGDGELLRRFFQRLSPETVYRRFMSPLSRPEQANPGRLLDVDHRDREAILAVEDGEIVGVARYARAPRPVDPDAAEVAVVVADAWQRRGIGTRLVSALAASAARAGVARLTLTTQADNRPALALIRRLRPDARLDCSYGVCEATLALDPAGGAW